VNWVISRILNKSRATQWVVCRINKWVVSHMIESVTCHIVSCVLHKWIIHVPQKWKRHVPHNKFRRVPHSAWVMSNTINEWCPTINASCPTYTRCVSHLWTSRVPRMGCHLGQTCYVSRMRHLSESYPHASGSRPARERSISHMWRRHVPLLNARMYERSMSHIWMQTGGDVLRGAGGTETSARASVCVSVPLFWSCYWCSERRCFCMFVCMFACMIHACIYMRMCKRVVCMSVPLFWILTSVFWMHLFMYASVHVVPHLILLCLPNAGVCVRVHMCTSISVTCVCQYLSRMIARRAIVFACVCARGALCTNTPHYIILFYENDYINWCILIHIIAKKQSYWGYPALSGNISWWGGGAVPAVYCHVHPPQFARCRSARTGLSRSHTLQHTATHCNTLQHTATQQAHTLTHVLSFFLSFSLFFSHSLSFFHDLWLSFYRSLVSSLCSR